MSSENNHNGLGGEQTVAELNRAGMAQPSPTRSFADLVSDDPRLEAMPTDPEERRLVAGIADGIHQALGFLGEDPEREGLSKTPIRVAKAWRFLTQGYEQDAKAILQSAVFNEHYDEMVLVKNIDFYSLCEHHVLPFFGKAHVAYIPDGRIVGLSKLPRVVEVFARRLQVQERLTVQIRDALQEVLKPRGVAVVLEAQHMCVAMRGVQKLNSITTTSAVSGAFESNSKTRAEFMRLIGHSS